MYASATRGQHPRFGGPIRLMGHCNTGETDRH